MEKILLWVSSFIILSTTIFTYWYTVLREARGIGDAFSSGLGSIYLLLGYAILMAVILLAWIIYFVVVQKWTMILFPVGIGIIIALIFY